MKLRLILAALMALAVASASAQSQVTKENVPGITNFARVQTTVACAGATKAEAAPEIKKMGFASIINLREATEAISKFKFFFEGHAFYFVDVCSNFSAEL